MDNNKFEDQIGNASSENVKSVIENQIYRSVEYVDTPSPRKSNISKIAIIGVFVVIILIFVTLLLPWYGASIKMSTLYINSDLYLTKIGVSTNFPGMAGAGTWDYSDLAGYEGIKPTVTEPIYITLYITIAALIIAILMLISFSGILFNFGNPYKLRKLCFVFGIATFVLALVACFYFMTAITGNMADTEGNKLGSFWYSYSTTDFGPMSAVAGPGYSWYLIVIAGIIALISSVFVFKLDIKSLSKESIQITRKRKGILVVLAAAVIIIVIVSVLTLFVFKVGNEGQEDISNFVGTWELDVKNSSGYQVGYNITNENWTFYENKTLNVATVYESGGSGYMRGPFSVKDDKLSFVFSSLNYAFSSDYNRLTLTDSQQTIILNKIQ